MAAVVRNKKPDDKFLLALRELVTNGSNGGNRQCFDCGQKGPTYVNMTIGSFVCTRCSGVLRGLTPPHRVKSISMATFTQDEIDFLKSHGNELCSKTWLGLWDPKRASQQQQDQRELIIDKYERKRYYLEPGSPLKSLNLKSSPAQNSNASAVRPNQNGHHHHQQQQQHQPNGVSLVGMSTNGYASIQLTPPAAQRTSNGQQKAVATVATASSTTAISRPQHHHHHNQHHHDAFGSLANGLTSLNSAGSTSTGALSDTSSCASNGFAAESDFVADFGSANIFDATSARSAGSPAVSSASSVSSTNGYAKVQPLRAAHLLQQQQQQQQQQALLNGSAISNGNTENFADFDHAPIYNAAAVSNNSNATVFHDWISDWSRRGFHDPFDDDDDADDANDFQIVTPSPPVPPAPYCPPPADNEPAPMPSIDIGNFWSHQEEDDDDDEDQDAFCSQLSPLNPFLPYLNNERRQRNRSTASGPSRSGTSSCSPFVPSNSYFTSSNDNSEEQPTNIFNGNFHDIFTWSAPLQNGHLNGGSKVTPSKSSPSEDRYAALKDLDEQLRELKASETAPVVTNEAPTPTNGNGNGHFIETFGTGHIINNNNNPNPFKGQQQQLSNHIVNPFQQQQSQQNLYGQLTLIPNGYAINPQQQQQAAHPHPQQQQQQQQASFFNFNNNGYALSQGLPNACGFGMANNPFAANTNNPFL